MVLYSVCEHEVNRRFGIAWVFPLEVLPLNMYRWCWEDVIISKSLTELLTLVTVYTETLWVGAGGGVCRWYEFSHFSIGTSASLNSGFNVLEAVHILTLQLVFLFMHFYMVIVKCLFSRLNTEFQICFPLQLHSMGTRQKERIWKEAVSLSYGS